MRFILWLIMRNRFFLSTSFVCEFYQQVAKNLFVPVSIEYALQSGEREYKKRAKTEDFSVCS